MYEIWKQFGRNNILKGFIIIYLFQWVRNCLCSIFIAFDLHMWHDLYAHAYDLILLNSDKLSTYKMCVRAALVVLVVCFGLIYFSKMSFKIFDKLVLY